MGIRFYIKLLAVTLWIYLLIHFYWIAWIAGDNFGRQNFDRQYTISQEVKNNYDGIREKYNELRTRVWAGAYITREDFK